MVIGRIPGVALVLDRDYWVLAVMKAGEPSSWILNPKDEQSALNIAVGEDVHDRSDDKLAEAPGFTRITRHPEPSTAKLLHGVAGRTRTTSIAIASYGFPRTTTR